jgi:selenide,water dikinase
LAEEGLVVAGTDITGFGMLGHLGSLCRASGVGAEIEAGKIPWIDREVGELITRECIPGGTRENLKAAEPFTDFGTASNAVRLLLADAQTSGGLLLCVKPRNLERVMKILRKRRVLAEAVIGRIVRSAKPRVWIKE